MNKYVFTPGQYKHMCELADAAIKISPEWKSMGHHDVLQDIRLLLSGIKPNRVFATGTDITNATVGNAGIVRRYEMDVVQYNLMFKYIGWAKLHAAPELLEKLNLLFRAMKIGRLEWVGNNYTSIVIAGTPAHTR